MKIAQNELQRALGNLEAMSAHLDAMDHTLNAFAKQVEGARHEMIVLRLDLNEIQQEIRAAVNRLEELRRAGEGSDAAPAPQV